MSPYNSLKLVKICNGNHDASTPHRAETNGVAQRAVRRVKEGTAIALVQKRTTRRIVGLRDGTLLLLAQCARHDGRWHDSIREEMWSRHLTDRERQVKAMFHVREEVIS